MLGGFSLDLGHAEVVSLFGPNGCGKTTLLNIVAGVLQPDGGSVEFSHDSREVGYVFQNYRDSLFPWLTLEENICFAARLRGTPSPEARGRLEEFVGEAWDDLPLHRFPYQASGGQLQMTAICRAVFDSPDVLLLDEPFSALDYHRRIEGQTRLGNGLARMKMATILVSHDVDQALLLGDRVCVLSASPSHVVAEVQVPGTRPRPVSWLESNACTTARTAVLAAFRQHVLN